MNKTVLVLVNHEIVIYNFRKELIKSLVDQGYYVIISCPNGKDIDKLTKLGAIHITSPIDRRGISLIKDFNLFYHYKNIVKKYKPRVILTYTIKPNLYGGFVSRLTKTPILVNITGLGTALQKKNFLYFFLLKFYKHALKNAHTIFFQNKENLNFMLNKGIIIQNYQMLPGSGVNINEFNYIDYPPDSSLNFLYVGRVMKAKGIDYYLEAAKTIKLKYPNTNFHIIGDFEEDYKKILDFYNEQNFIVYHGKVSDVKMYFKKSHIIVHPSFHEGMSNVLLEASSSGRPIIASNIAGCREIIDEGINGFMFEVGNQLSLVNKIEKFISLSYEEKKLMGMRGREKVSLEFNRSKVVDIYMDIIKKIMEDE
jgi:glycosyltransferase involved in cell wall biosynthesis